MKRTVLIAILVTFVTAASAQALEVIRDIRARYDGRKRSPFDEAECGHHYARAMASWAAVPALAGFSWDGRTEAMAFAAGEGTWFWSNGDAWGTCRIEAGGRTAELEVLYGTVLLRSFRLGAGPAKTFKAPRTVEAGGSLRIEI